jgi:hypothetical protein
MGDSSVLWWWQSWEIGGLKRTLPTVDAVLHTVCISGCLTYYMSGPSRSRVLLRRCEKQVFRISRKKRSSSCAQAV